MKASIEPKGAGIEDLVGQLNQTGKVTRDALKPVGQALLEMVTYGFEQEKDPYGRKWKPQRTGRVGQTLSDTGRLKNSWRVVMDSQRLQIHFLNPTRYAAIHQFGGTIRPKEKKALRFKLGDAWVVARKVTIPQRMMVPTAGIPPDTWGRTIREEVQYVLDEIKEGDGT